MFFQSFYAQYTLSGFNAVNVSLFINNNALVATYIGNEVLALGDDPFNITPYVMNPTSENDGLPTFELTLSGIPSD